MGGREPHANVKEYTRTGPLAVGASVFEGLVAASKSTFLVFFRNFRVIFQQKFDDFSTHRFFLLLRYNRRCKDPVVLADSHDCGLSNA